MSTERASEPTASLRCARADDISRLRDIERAGDAMFVAAGHEEFGGDGQITREEATSAIERTALRVAIDEADRVIGWSLTGQCGLEAYLAQLCVDPELQGFGTGGLLLDDVVERAIADGHRSIVLNTQADIPWNRPWYARRGFVIVSRADWTDAMQAITNTQTEAGLDWSTRVHMRRTLP